MPIPELNEYGLLPSGIFECTEAEIIERYCATNPNRQAIWDLFKQFLCTRVPFELPNFLFIDGGFTSDKPITSDVDVVADISHLDDAQAFQAYCWSLNNRDELKQMYKVDFWVSHPQIINNLVDFFQYIKKEEALSKGLTLETKKGLLRMSI